MPRALSKETQDLYAQMVRELELAGQGSAYPADANETDPRYLSYGVRAPATKALIKKYAPTLRQLSTLHRVRLAEHLIASGYGEQKTIALHLLDQSIDFFSPDKFTLVDKLVRQLNGWSKVDAYTGSFLRQLLEQQPAALLSLVQGWNHDPDKWLRRTSVVLFTRKVAKSGLHTELALALCERLKFDPEDMVQKGVGWCLKDLMHADKTRVLDYVKQLRKQGAPATLTLYALRDIKGQERASILKE